MEDWFLNFSSICTSYLIENQRISLKSTHYVNNLSEMIYIEVAMLFNKIFCHTHMSRIVRKPDFCLCENKGADQLRGNREADQRLCFRYTDSTFPLLLISEISSFKPASETVQAGLCRTWSEIPKTGFLASRLI